MITVNFAEQSSQKTFLIRSMPVIQLRTIIIGFVMIVLKISRISLNGKCKHNDEWLGSRPKRQKGPEGRIKSGHPLS